LVSKIQQGISRAGLHALWSRLDDVQLLAVAEAVYAVDRQFHPDCFREKYGWFGCQAAGACAWQKRAIGLASALSVLVRDSSDWANPLI